MGIPLKANLCVLQLKDKIGEVGQNWKDDEMKLKLLSLLGFLEMTTTLQTIKIILL
jgi:hypothetical protein